MSPGSVEQENNRCIQVIIYIMQSGKCLWGFLSIFEQKSPFPWITVSSSECCSLSLSGEEEERSPAWGASETQHKCLSLTPQIAYTVCLHVSWRLVWWWHPHHKRKTMPSTANSFTVTRNENWQQPLESFVNGHIKIYLPVTAECEVLCSPHFSKLRLKSSVCSNCLCLSLTSNDWTPGHGK